MNTRSMLLAAGLTGIIMALVSSIPIVSCVNFCCWAGIWGSGILSVLAYRQIEKAQPNLTVGQGAVLGLAAGLVGAVLVTIFSLFTSLLFSGMNAASTLDTLNQIPGLSDSIPEASREMVTQFGSIVGGTAVGGMCNFVLYPLFGMIGGVISTALIWKK